MSNNHFSRQKESFSCSCWWLSITHCYFLLSKSFFSGFISAFFTYWFTNLCCIYFQSLHFTPKGILIPQGAREKDSLSCVLKHNRFLLSFHQQWSLICSRPTFSAVPCTFYMSWNYMTLSQVDDWIWKLKKRIG